MNLILLRRLLHVTRQLVQQSSEMYDKKVAVNTLLWEV